MRNKFGNFTTRLREKNNEKITDMANILSITRNQLSLVENGRQKPKLEWVDILSQKYSLTAEETAELKQIIMDIHMWDEDKKIINISNLEIQDQELAILFVKTLTMVPQAENVWLKNTVKSLIK